MTSSEDGDSRTMLISIHPQHVQKIISGQKTIELRRRQPTAAPGTEVLIYSTAPVAALTARCRIRAIESLPPHELWARYEAKLGVTQEAFLTYFDGSKNATAVHLTDVSPLERPIPLTALRRTGPFNPPQTWHFLSLERANALLGAERHKQPTPVRQNQKHSPLGMLRMPLAPRRIGLLARRLSASIHDGPLTRK